LSSGIGRELAALVAHETDPIAVLRPDA